MYLEIVSEETIKEDLEDLFSMDSDFSGENGEEYVSTEAIEAGFKSNAAYHANRIYNEAKKPFNLEEMVMDMFNLFRDEEGYFWDINLRTLPFEDKLIVAMSHRPINQD